MTTWRAETLSSSCLDAGLLVITLLHTMCACNLQLLLKPWIFGMMSKLARSDTMGSSEGSSAWVGAITQPGPLFSLARNAIQLTNILRAELMRGRHSRLGRASIQISLAALLAWPKQGVFPSAERWGIEKPYWCYLSFWRVTEVCSCLEL